MGRYYNGSIEGKFWFGVQSSTDADFFGVSHVEPNYVEYHFEKDDIKGVKEGLDICDKKLGKFKRRLKKFFEMNNGYNDEMIALSFGITTEKVRYYLEWYARMILGQKIYKCLKKNSYCSFEAEL